MSERMGGINKQLAVIGGVPVFVASALKFEECAAVDEIIIAAPENETDSYRSLAAGYGVSKLKAVIKGGGTRFLSVKNALEAVSAKAELIAIHDGARPLIKTSDIARVIADAERYGASIAAVPAADTVKFAEGGLIEVTPPRKKLYYAQTPQVFDARLYRDCLESLGSGAENVTDDSEILERCGISVHITEITGCNLKITRPDDIAAANAVYMSRNPGIAVRTVREGQKTYENGYRLRCAQALRRQKAGSVRGGNTLRGRIAGTFGRGRGGSRSDGRSSRRYGSGRYRKALPRQQRRV